MGPRLRGGDGFKGSCSGSHFKLTVLAIDALFRLELAANDGNPCSHYLHTSLQSTAPACIPRGRAHANCKHRARAFRLVGVQTIGRTCLARLASTHVRREKRVSAMARMGTPVRYNRPKAASAFGQKRTNIPVSTSVHLAMTLLPTWSANARRICD